MTDTLPILPILPGTWQDEIASIIKAVLDEFDDEATLRAQVALRVERYLDQRGLPSGDVYVHINFDTQEVGVEVEDTLMDELDRLDAARLIQA